MPRTTSTRRALSIGAVLALAACGPSAPPAPTPAAPKPGTVAEPLPPPDAEPMRLSAADAARLAGEIRAEVPVRLAPGLKVDLWAPDSMLADPVGMDVDDQGHVFVTRTNRQKHSEFDIRGHPDWMIESIGLKTPEERRAFLHRALAPERSDSNAWFADLNGDGSKDWKDLDVEKEEIIRLDDTDGDGRADLSRVILNDFHDEITDVAGGILARGDTVFLAVSPDLWRLTDTDGDGVLDTKQSISHGYGVHVGFGGHGMSGTIMGPDGRLYWQIGDLGANVVGPDGKRWSYPNQGVIVRANPDGSDFEVFAAGMRNTHEFDFDEFGNLVTEDNDGDHPTEKERILYVTNGQDSGWRATWQYGKYVDPENNGYNVWMDEKMWQPHWEGQAAYFTPPVADYYSGPAGFLHEPGTALSDDWRGNFFVSEFVGTAAGSKIHAFTLDPQGAGFTLGRDTVMLSGILTDDLAWGPDGAMYLADWIDGWGTKNLGRVWKLDTPATAGSAIRAETKSLLAEDLSARGEAQLLPLLMHADMRVREKAQFVLAARGAVRTLLAAARQTENRLGRFHGIWGIGQVARRDAKQAALLVPFLTDSDGEVRAQAAKTLGDVRYAAAAPKIVPLLKDAEPRARFFAAEALGRMAYRPAVQPILAMLRENGGRDVYLRSAGTIALWRIGDPAPILALADDPSKALRVDAVVTLRRMRNPGVARFLQDADEYVVTEAARAVNDDGGIEEALPALAALLGTSKFSNEALLRREVSANLRVGDAAAAQRVAAFAAAAGGREVNRVDAIASLGVWPKPSVLDRVDGYSHGPVERDSSIARNAFAPIAAPLLSSGTTPVKVAAAEAAGRLHLAGAGDALYASARGDTAAAVRIAALEALREIGDRRTEEAIRLALADRDQEVRMTALGLVSGLDLPPERSAALLGSVLGKGSLVEQQSAVTALGKMNTASAQGFLNGMLDQYAVGELTPGLELEVAEAIAAGGSPAQRARLARLQAAHRPGDVLAGFRDALVGGSAQRGARVVFQGNGQCTRCHSIGQRGADVGPNLRGVGARLDRETILQELVAPSARLAPGFGTVVVTLKNGDRVAGSPKSETATELVLQTGDDTRTIPKSQIAQRTNASPMPPMGGLLSHRELRDVVEFLSSLK